MMKTISVRVDSELKDKSSKILADIGMSTSQFVKMALTQLVRQGQLPFNRKSYEATVVLGDETVQSLIEAQNRKTETTFEDFDAVNEALNKADKKLKDSL